MLRDVLTSLPGLSSWKCDEINPIWRHGNLTVDHDELDESHVTDAIKQFIHKEFRKISKANSGDRVVEKSCANVVRLPFVSTIFPDADYVFIYRDGRDAIASAMKRWHAPFEWKYTMDKLRYVPIVDLPYYALNYGSVRIKQLIRSEKKLEMWGFKLENMAERTEGMDIHEICALQWNTGIQKTLQTFQDKSIRVYNIKYEDFVHEPKNQLNRLLDWIGHAQDDREIDLSHISARNIGKYKKELSDAQIRAIEKLCSESLQNLYYL